MKFEFDFNKIKAAGMDVAGKSVDLANDLAGRAKRETRILNDQSKLAKAQRELGALVYSLAKNGESNQPLLDKYIDTISALEQEIDQLRAMDQPAQPEESVEPAVADFDAEDAAEPNPAQENAAADPFADGQPQDGHYCHKCGAPVPEDALFCNRCGAQL